MNRKNIKIGNEYYVVHNISQLFSITFPAKSLIEKFTMAQDIFINKPHIYI